MTIRTTSDVLELLERAAADLLGRRPSTTRARALTAVAATAVRVVESHDLDARITALEGLADTPRRAG